MDDNSLGTDTKAVAESAPMTTGAAGAEAERGRWWRRPVPGYAVPTACRRVVLPFVGFVVDADDDHRKRVERFFQVPMLILSLLVLPLIAAHHYFAYYLSLIHISDHSR